MDRPTTVSLLTRAGSLLMAIGLAFALMGFLAGSTAASAAIPYQQGANIQAQSFFIACCNPPYVSPKEVIVVNLTTTTLPVSVYIVKANQTDFQAWVRNETGGSVSLGYGAEYSLNLFQDYLAAHPGDLLENYTLNPGPFHVIKYYPTDVEPLMIVLSNPYHAQSNFTYGIIYLSIQLPPNLGLSVAAVFVIVGVALFAIRFLPREPRHG
ncbi:MAG: hypothetical protein M1368_06500 [Thaumarchaeota archaeon]|nr:hypothetical protein [Nitrososphaerota archaeon]